MKKIVTFISYIAIVIMPIKLFAYATGDIEREIVDGISWTYTLERKRGTTYHAAGLGRSGSTAISTKTTGEITTPYSFHPDVGYTFPVQSVLANAFSNCSEIVGYKESSKIWKIGRHAFYGCTKLQEVITSAEEFGDYVFQNCISLRSLTLKSTSITEIGAYILKGCSRDVSLTIKDTNYKYQDGYLLSSDGKTFVKTLFDDEETLVVPQGVEKIKVYAIQSSELVRQIELPESVTNIGNSAFYQCQNLEEVYIGSNVQSLSHGNPFNQCNKLRKIITSPGDSERVRMLFEKELPSSSYSSLIKKVEFVERKTPTPIISPSGKSIIDTSISVVMSCEDPIAEIYYTIDGSDPTEESNHYTKRFRVSNKTIVRAIAVRDGFWNSDVVTAEYALGQCPDPTITSVGGTTFQHQGKVVAIDWSCADGLVRYTLDGSEPTTESPVYNEPFTIDETTTVKAKAFGETYFNSTTVTQTLTRVWEQVATPIISAVESFSGSKTVVSLSCTTEGALIRYTLDGSEPNTHSRRYSGPFEIRESTVVKAFATLADYSNSEIATKTISKVWGIGDSVGLPDHAFTTEDGTGWVDDGGTAMKSGKITHEQTSVLSSTFVGKGRLSFELMTSCEEDDPAYIEYDHFEIWIDDDRKMKQDGVHEWAEFAYDLAEGTHVVEWKYVKDEMDEAPYPGEDCVRVRNIVWMPEKTQLSGEKVPLAWLKEKYPSLGTYYFDYEEKAESDAANGMKVWACYVAGLDPTISTDQLKANITMTNNVPYITWTPNLNTNGEVRVYKVWGKAQLEDTDEAWMCPTNNTHRFFKVSVEMP